FLGFAVICIALITRKGWTPGQWLFELEVIDVKTGAKPSLGRAVIRVILPIALPLVELLVKFGVEIAGYQLYGIVNPLLSASIVIAPIGLIWASLRSVSKQTFWDKLSGTMVRYRTRRLPTM